MRPLAHMRKLLGRSDRGTACVELAFVAPVLIVAVLGMSDVAMTTLAKLKSANATAAAVDLSAQAANLQATDMADIFAGAGGVMAPIPAGNLTFQITSVASDGNGRAFVHWRCGQGGLPPLHATDTYTTLANGDPISNALNLNNYSSGGFNYNGTNTTVVQAESQFSYTAPAQFILKGAQSMTAAYLILPRQAGYVGFPWDGIASHQPPTPTSATHAGSLVLANGATCSYAN